MCKFYQSNSSVESTASNSLVHERCQLPIMATQAPQGYYSPSRVRRRLPPQTSCQAIRLSHVTSRHESAASTGTVNAIDGREEAPSALEASSFCADPQCSRPVSPFFPNRCSGGLALHVLYSHSFIPLCAVPLLAAAAALPSPPLPLLLLLERTSLGASR
jgi:hypothetical protein